MTGIVNVQRVRLSHPLRDVAAPGCHIVREDARHAPGTTGLTMALSESFQRLQEEVHELLERQSNGLREMQELAVELAINVAERIVRATIDREAHSVDQMVKEIVDTLQPEETLWIHLHPQDLAAVSEATKHHGMQGASIRFKASDTVQRGECHAETSDLILTSSIPMQLAQIRSRLLQSLEHAETERRQTSQSSTGLQRFPDRRATG